MQTCVGFDIGRSAVKIVASWGAAGRVELSYPSCICPAFELPSEQEVNRSKTDTVSLGESSYFFGETALIQGIDDFSIGLSDNWALSNEHAVLFLGGLKKLKELNVPDIDTAIIVVGVSAANFAAQKNDVATCLKRIAPEAEIKVFPQSLGPFQQMIFNTDGSINRVINADDANWAIIEVGQFTTDYALIFKGRIISTCLDSCEGMKIASEQLQRELRKKSISVSLSQASTLLETKVLKNYGKSIDVEEDIKKSLPQLCEKIANVANQLFGNRARELDGILLAGGGAPLIFPALKERFPNAVLAVNPRFAVADGFSRFAMACNLRESGNKNVG